jgi:hypothetical protein
MGAKMVDFEIKDYFCEIDKIARGTKNAIKPLLDMLPRISYKLGFLFLGYLEEGE